MPHEKTTEVINRFYRYYDAGFGIGRLWRPQYHDTHRADPTHTRHHTRPQRTQPTHATTQPRRDIGLIKSGNKKSNGSQHVIRWIFNKHL